MSNLTVEVAHDHEKARKSLKRWLLEKPQAWINGLLEAEMSEHLQRWRYEPLSGDQANQAGWITQANVPNILAAAMGRSVRRMKRPSCRRSSLSLEALAFNRW